MIDTIDLTSKISQLEFKLGIDYFVFSSDQINRNMIKNLVKKEKMIFIYLTSVHNNQIINPTINPTGFSKIIRKCLNKIDWYLIKIHKSKIRYETKFIYRRLGIFSSLYINIYSYNPNVSLNDFTSSIVSTMSTNNVDIWFAPIKIKRKQNV